MLCWICYQLNLHFEILGIGLSIGSKVISIGLELSSRPHLGESQIAIFHPSSYFAIN